MSLLGCVCFAYEMKSHDVPQDSLEAVLILLRQTRVLGLQGMCIHVEFPRGFMPVSPLPQRQPRDVRKPPHTLSKAVNKSI